MTTKTVKVLPEGKVLTEAKRVRDFMRGGKATFTVRSKKTGVRFTYKVTTPKGDAHAVYFVRVLTGPDNYTNYKYIGYVRGGTFTHGGAKAKAGPDAPSVVAFAYTHKAANGSNETLPEALEFRHAGKCCCCGRKLTDPLSIELGIGPVCGNHKGTSTGKVHKGGAMSAC